MELMRAHTLFAGGEQVHRFEPDMQPDLAAFHDGADRYGELLAAGVALEKTGAMRRPRQLGNAVTEGAAMRANRADRPDARLEPLAGAVVILKRRIVEF